MQQNKGKKGRYKDNKGKIAEIYRKNDNSTDSQRDWTKEVIEKQPKQENLKKNITPNYRSCSRKSERKKKKKTDREMKLKDRI